MVNYLVTDTEAFNAKFSEDGKIMEKKKETWIFGNVPKIFPNIPHPPGSMEGEITYYISFESNSKKFTHFKLRDVYSSLKELYYDDEMLVSSANLEKGIFK